MTAVKARNVRFVPPNRLKFEIPDNIWVVRHTETPSGCKAVLFMN